MSFATAGPVAFDWKRWPETDALVREWVGSALEGNAFAAELARRMECETNTRFGDWLDHLVVANQPSLPRRLRTLGYALQTEPYAVGTPSYAHSGGTFPKIVIANGVGSLVSRWRSRSSRSPTSRGRTTSDCRSWARRSGPIGSVTSPAQERRWRSSSGGDTRGSSPIPGRWRARGGCGPMPPASPWPLARSGRLGADASTKTPRESPPPRPRSTR